MGKPARLRELFKKFSFQKVRHQQAFLPQGLLSVRKCAPAFRIQQRPKEPRQAGDRDGARKAVRLMFQPHADIVFASLSGSDVARQYGLARRPECLIESVSVSEIPLPKKLGHEGMPGKVAEKGNPQNVHDDLRGGYLSWKPQTSVCRSGPISTVCPD